MTKKVTEKSPVERNRALRLRRKPEALRTPEERSWLAQYDSSKRSKVRPGIASRRVDAVTVEDLADQAAELDAQASGADFVIESVPPGGGPAAAPPAASSPPPAEPSSSPPEPVVVDVPAPPPPAAEPTPLKPETAGMLDARKAALTSLMSIAASSFEEAHKDIETTMGRPWMLPVSYWREIWLPLTVEVTNRYLPDWVSGPLVDGVAVGMPPFALMRAAGQLRKAGYQLGVPGKPGQGAQQAAALPVAAGTAPPSSPPPRRTVDQAAIAQLFPPKAAA
jgi:hypothetical protein